MAKKGSSKAQKERYAVYKANKTWETNRLRKLERHLKKHPNDKNALHAIDRISYRRHDNRNGKPQECKPTLAYQPVDTRLTIKEKFKHEYYRVFG